MGYKNCPPFSSSYEQLSDMAYFFTTGAGFASQIDSCELDPVIAQIFEYIRPLAIEIEPYAKQLWCQLERENNF